MDCTFRLIYILFFTLIGLNTFGQSPSTFVIANNGGISNVTPFENALSSANLENYRLADKRTTMKFANGILVELLSGKEVVALGGTVDLESMRKHDPDALKTSLFELHSSGIIMERKDLLDFKSKK